jgi:hypothetical protein
MSGTSTTPMATLFGRLFWMLIGPLALLVTLYSIVSSGRGWWTATDIVYFVILGGMVLGRWIEFRGGNATTSDGKPTTQADLRRYVLMLVTLGPVAWGVANFVGNHLLTR